jgi:diguanylate cyclase (GGDEF)-like protein
MSHSDKPNHDAVLAPLAETEGQPDVPAGVQAVLNGIVARQDQLTRELSLAREQIERLERTTLEDPLLPMLSTRAFLRESNRMLLDSARHVLSTTFLYLNVDRFCVINARFGQSGGNAVLLSISNGIMRLLRGSDLFGRVGADEFGVLLMRSDPDSVRPKCERLVNHVQSNPIDYLGSPIPVTVMTSLLDCRGFETPERLIEAARKDVQSQRVNGPTAEFRPDFNLS